MNVLGIITEYNPFHYGHLYHLQKAKEVSKADLVLCIMNGNFVQRGEPALINKWARTRMALKNGVDLVIELPLVYGIRSAEYFAFGAIQLLNATGLVDKIVFGSESGKLEILERIAKMLHNEDEYFQKRLTIYLNNGDSFPKAREKALLDYISTNSPETISRDEVYEVISEPNNILGIEYIKALLKTSSPIIPLTIKREGSGYHSREIKGELASATAIRERIYQQGINSVKGFLPLQAWEILQQEFLAGRAPLQKELWGRLILAKLRSVNTEMLSCYAEVDNGLENRIFQAAHEAGTFNVLVDKIKTRAFTWTRIQRNLLHILFNIQERDFKELDNKGPQYLRVLGISKKGEKLLSELTKKATLPVITKPADYITEIAPDSDNPGVKSLSYDIIASDLYTLLYPDVKQRTGHNDYTMPLIKEGNGKL